MKILVTGLNSYIGNSFIEWMKESEWIIDKTSLRKEVWKIEDWSCYDAILHVAGIAHADVTRATAEIQEKYYKINSDLTEAVARKAKQEGVKQFVYMSSVIVYGDSAPIGKTKEIHLQSDAFPANFYGDSKLQGERKIVPLADEGFKVTIIRTPMVYGIGSKGNFPKLKKLAEITPIFPKIENRRSMIYIKNLCEFVRICIEKELEGVFLPQNKEIVSTSELVRKIALTDGKNIRLVPGLTWILKLLSHITGYINKIFGNMEIAQTASQHELEYCLYSLEMSLQEMKKEG